MSIRKDSVFLAELGIMDYSLLLGIEQKDEDDSILIEESKNSIN